MATHLIHRWRRIPGTQRKEKLFRCTRCLAQRRPVPRADRQSEFDEHLFCGFGSEDWGRAVPVCERREAQRATIDAQAAFVKTVAASGTVSPAAWRFYMKNGRFPHEGELSAEAATKGPEEVALPLLTKPAVAPVPAPAGGAS